MQLRISGAIGGIGPFNCWPRRPYVEIIEEQHVSGSVMLETCCWFRKWALWEQVQLPGSYRESRYSSKNR